MFKEPDSPSPRNVTAVKLMSRTAAIYEVCTFRPVGRQPELGGRKKDEGGALKWCPRKQGRSFSRDVEL